MGYIFASIFALLGGAFVVSTGRMAFDTGNPWVWAVFIGFTVLVVGAALLLPESRDR